MVVHLAERRNGARPELTAADVGARLPDGQAVERPLLAGLLTAGDEAVDAVVATGLDPEHFSSQDLGAVYGTMRRLRREQRAANLEAVAAELRRTGPPGGLGRLVATGGLHALLAHLPPPSPDADGVIGQLVSLARTVGEYGTLRLGTQFAFRVARLATAGMPPARFLAGLRAEVDRLTVKAPAHVRPPGPAGGVSAFNSFLAEGGVSAESPLPVVPAFPVWVIPEPLATLIRQGTDAIGCPSGLVANPALAHAAGVIGNLFRLRVKQGWVELANLWPVVVADPGSAKTPAAGVARRPVEQLQREAFDAHARATQDYEGGLEVWEAGDKKTRGEKPAPPAPLEHYFTDDVTTEGLARILGDPGSTTPGVTASRDELAGLVNSFNEYKGGKGSDRQTWLSLWAGRDTKVDRASRGATILRDPVVPVTGSIQPELLPTLAADAKRDGFVERFLFTFEDAPPVGWQSAEVQDAAVTAVAALYRRIRGSRGEGTEGIVDLSTAARTRFAHWCDDNAERQRYVSGMLRGVYAKLPSQVARLALVLHCLRHAERAAAERVAKGTVEHAILLGDYYLAHAVKVLARFGPAALSGSGLAGRLLRALQAAPDHRLMRTELHAALGGSVKAPTRDAALEELTRLGLVVEVAGESGGPGRPAVFYELQGCARNELNAETPLPDTCDECGAPVDVFTADGRPKCEAHGAAEQGR